MLSIDRTNVDSTSSLHQDLVRTHKTVDSDAVNALISIYEKKVTSYKSWIEYMQNSQVYLKGILASLEHRRNLHQEEQEGPAGAQNAIRQHAEDIRIGEHLLLKLKMGQGKYEAKLQRAKVIKYNEI